MFLSLFMASFTAMAAANPASAIRLWPQAWPMSGSASYSKSMATVGPPAVN